MKKENIILYYFLQVTLFIYNHNIVKQIDQHNNIYHCDNTQITWHVIGHKEKLGNHAILP
jgi:hypothetical protein